MGGRTGLRKDTDHIRIFDLPEIPIEAADASHVGAHQKANGLVCVRFHGFQAFHGSDGNCADELLRRLRTSTWPARMSASLLHWR